MSQDAFDKTASQYERKLARQRQLELMEAAASGTAPSLQLDTSGIESDGTSSSSGLRSRSETARRFLSDEDEDAFLVDQQPKLLSPVRQQQPFAKSLFDLRGRPDGLPGNTGLNLMDHQTGVYREQTRSERFLNTFRGLFYTKTETEQFDADAPADDFTDYGRRKRQSGFVALCKSFWHDRKRRAMVTMVLAAIIFVVIVSVTTVRVIHPSAKVLRQQNSARFNTIMDTIIASGVTHNAVFLDYTSPEHHSLRWVAYSDPAKLAVDDPMLITRYALATFFYSSYLSFEKLAGRQNPIEIGEKQWEGVPNPGWTRHDNWLTEQGVCNWYGIHCTPEFDPAGGKPITQYNKNLPPFSLKIVNNRMVGHLVTELKALEDLKMLDLSNNRLTGAFPTNMGRLIQLEMLILSKNHLTGSLPSDFGFFEGLKKMDLSSNSFTGQLPKELSRLYHLETLQLSHNNFTGGIPDLTECSSLKTLHLEYNRLDTTVPYKLALLTSLTEIHINHNRLKGTIPGEIDSIRGLQKFRAEFNEITGKLPNGMFSKMMDLKEIALEYNKITGTIPRDMSEAMQLEVLSLSGNQFKGSIPANLGKASKLTGLHLNKNALTGTLSESLGQLTNLKELWLEGNHFKGSIPTQLSKCTALETLFLDANKLTGSVPTQLGALSELKSLHIHANNVQGDFPMDICNLKTQSHLTSIEADCKSKITCSDSCCQKCH